MISSPEMKTKLEELGLAGVGSTPAEFRKFIVGDIAFQSRVMKLARIDKQ
jgi:tripartite-type tricarboxylate transporter receptor subunit TctC